MAPSDLSLTRRWVNPLSVHLLTLVGATIVLVLLARGQWFFYDEWDFLRDPGNPALLLQPHVGHWSTSPILITALLQRMFGLATYWPYLLLVIAAHLAIAHVLWRIMLRVGVAPWIAVALALVFLLYGGAGENVFWAFQIGYLGGILVGLIAALLADRMTRERFWRRYPAVLAIALLSLTFAGTALPILVVTALVAWRRAGFLRAAALIAPVLGVYLAWYVYQSITFHEPGFPPATIAQIVDPGGVLLFAGTMTAGTFAVLLPIVFFGPALLVAIAVYFFATLRAAWRTRTLMLGMVCAAVLFALLTAYTRLNASGIDGAAGGRYLYMEFAMLLPLLGLAASALARRSRWLYGLLVAAMLVVAVFGAIALHETAREQRQVEEYTEDVLMGAAEVLDENPQIPDTANPEPVWAPTLTVGDLRHFLERGMLPLRGATLSGLLTASANLESSVAPADGALTCSPATESVTALPAEGTVVRVPLALYLRVYASTGSTIGADHALLIPAGTWRVSYSGEGESHLRIPEESMAEVELCH